MSEIKKKLDQLESKNRLPKEHKEAVLKTITSAKLFGDLAQLFTKDYAKTSTSIVIQDEKKSDSEEE